MIDVNLGMLGSILKISNPRKLLVNLYDVLQDRISLEKIKEFIKIGFERTFNVKFKEKVLTSMERRIAENFGN